MGNHVFAVGGWRSSGSTSVGFLVVALLLCAVRGPREKGWMGWTGGWAVRKVEDKVRKADEERGHEDMDKVGLAEKSQEASSKDERETKASADIDLESSRKAD